MEFVELFDGGTGNTPLDGLVVVLIDGIGDVAYRAFDLDGYVTNPNGYFVIGNPAVPNVNRTISEGTLRDGENNVAHAVALYYGNASDFNNGTVAGTANLIDAMIYDMGNADDPGLQVLLNPGQPQINETLGGLQEINSMQRCPNGSGGVRNTITYSLSGPTSGMANSCANAADAAWALYE